jgi:hypothetical protein
MLEGGIAILALRNIHGFYTLSSSYRTMSVADPASGIDVGTLIIAVIAVAAI